MPEIFSTTPPLFLPSEGAIDHASLCEIYLLVLFTSTKMANDHREWYFLSSLSTCKLLLNSTHSNKPRIHREKNTTWMI